MGRVLSMASHRHCQPCHPTYVTARSDVTTVTIHVTTTTNHVTPPRHHHPRHPPPPSSPPLALLLSPPLLSSHVALAPHLPPGTCVLPWSPRDPAKGWGWWLGASSRTEFLGALQRILGGQGGLRTCVNPAIGWEGAFQSPVFQEGGAARPPWLCMKRNLPDSWTGLSTDESAAQAAQGPGLPLLLAPVPLPLPLLSLKPVRLWQSVRRYPTSLPSLGPRWARAGLPPAGWTGACHSPSPSRSLLWHKGGHRP